MVTTGKPGRKLYRESTCKRFNLDTVLSEKSWMLSSDFPLNIENLSSIVYVSKPKNFPFLASCISIIFNGQIVISSNI